MRRSALKIQLGASGVKFAEAMLHLASQGNAAALHQVLGRLGTEELQVIKQMLEKLKCRCAVDPMTDRTP